MRQSPRHRPGFFFAQKIDLWVVLIIYDETSTFKDESRRPIWHHIKYKHMDQNGSRPIGVEDMSIKINKLVRASIMKMSPAHADPALVKEVELSREKAWHDAYLNGGIIN